MHKAVGANGNIHVMYLLHGKISTAQVLFGLISIARSSATVVRYTQSIIPSSPHAF